MNKVTEAIINKPDEKNILSPIYFCDQVMEKILRENLTCFQKTLDMYIKTKENCNGPDKKHLYRKSMSILPIFIEEYKNSNNKSKESVNNYIGDRYLTPFGTNWYDIKNDISTPFEFKKDFLVQQETDIRETQKSLPIAEEDVSPIKVLFTNFQAPGDIVMLTAAIRDLHLNHPGKYITDVKTSSQHIWEGNPYIEWAKGKPLNESDPDVKTFKLGYPLIHQSNQGPYHFSEAFTEEIEYFLNIRIKERICKGDIHIRPEEDMWGYTERATWFKPYGIDPNSEYWVIDCGHKNDFTAKFWGRNKFQELVNRLKGKIQFVQIGHTAHIHYPLDGAINLIGKTDDRQCIRLIWASSGVVTPVSWPMTLAAALPVKNGTCNNRLERPCVIISGGREPSRWQSYCNHQFIHTNGCLPCCDRGGCWASRTKPIGDGDEKDTKNLCGNVTIDDFGEEVPYCMHMISVEDVVRRIEMYSQFYTESREIKNYNKR